LKKYQDDFVDLNEVEKNTSANITPTINSTFHSCPIYYAILYVVKVKGKAISTTGRGGP
jgi:hypothetical protein